MFRNLGERMSLAKSCLNSLGSTSIFFYSTLPGVPRVLKTDVLQTRKTE